MNDLRPVNDRISSGPALPGAALQLLLPITAAAAALLVPVLVWQIAVVGLALLGMLFPPSLGGWLSIACLTIGLLLAEPGIWQAMLAMFLVHLMHVLSSLLPIVPWLGGVVIAALRPTLRRLLVVQLVAQPATLGVMLLQTSATTAVGGAVLLGAVALATFTVAFLSRVGSRSNGV